MIRPFRARRYAGSRQPVAGTAEVEVLILLAAFEREVF